MFDDATAAWPSGSSFEHELRALLDYYAPVTRREPPVLCELGVEFGWHTASDAAGAPDVEDEFGGYARVWDAQFAAGAAALAEARAAAVVIGRGQARQARALAGFARSRPVALDRPDAEVGAAAAGSRAARPSVLAGVSEWAVDEVAVALAVTGEAAGRLLAESLRLVESLPATLAAVEAGDLGWAHARVLAELLAPLPDPVRAAAEARLLARAADETPAQLRAAARRVVARMDADALKRRVAAAVRERGVALYPAEDAMATLAAVFPLPVGRAVYDALSRCAEQAATPGDERTTAQRMADCLAALVLRPGEHGMAPVQARLTLIATVRTMLGGARPGAEEPGEVDGDVIPAAVVRQLAATLGLLPSDDPDPADDDPADDDPADDDPATTAPRAEGAGDSRLAARRAALADLLTPRTLTGTALAHRPHLALVDELSGALLALTDGPALRLAALTGRGLGPPPPSPGYRPGPALDRYVRLRDRRCRFPGCRARPIRCDLDHTTPWPHGTTSADNLCCLCRHHHRLSHQAPGWHLHALPDGGLRWTTPTGQVLTIHPPGYGTDDDPPRADPPEAPDAPDPPPF